jgi:[CysO sulfur-carrier protein]-thiocarboxylate-dependent cysteine synthase
MATTVRLAAQDRGGATRGAYRDIVDAIGNTPLVEVARLSPNPKVRMFAKLEGNNPTGSVKDRIARSMIERAEASGELTADRILLEPTSGNTGIALAMIARRKGYRMVAVLPDNVSPERRTLLSLYGAEVVLTDGAKGSNGAISVAEEMARDPRYLMLYQYGNEGNPQAHYETTGPEILADLPEVDTFVAGLGTGGTLMGVGRRLKEHDAAIRVVAAEPHPGEQVQGLRTLADGFIPPILDLDLLDRKIVVTSDEALVWTRALAEQEGIFAGISSGAVLSVARRVAERMESGNIVALLADGGWKYLSTGLWTRPLDEIREDVRRGTWW